MSNDEVQGDLRDLRMGLRQQGRELREVMRQMHNELADLEIRIARIEKAYWPVQLAAALADDEGQAYRIGPR